MEYCLNEPLTERKNMLSECSGKVPCLDKSSTNSDLEEAVYLCMCASILCYRLFFYATLGPRHTFS